MSKTGFALDTVISISIYDDMERGKAEELLSEAFDEIERYEGIFSAEIEGSDVSRINSAGLKETKVDVETVALIDIALKYSNLTDGAFDITIRSVSKLWDFNGDKDTPPEPGRIREALRHVGYDKLVLNKDENTVRLLDEDTEIDLGGIAKGYIADRIKEQLKIKGVKSAIINLGGNVVLIGDKDGKPFNIGIEKPFSDGEMISTIEASDRSVVTSGNYERYFYNGGRLYHHILDSSTGYPVESGLNAVTIVSERSVDGDALSTACYCLGYEKSQELLKKLNDADIKAIFIDSDNKMQASR